MFHKIFVEEGVKEHPRTLSILQGSFLEKSQVVIIDKIEDVFQKVKKPYLQKRTTLNLFIGTKKGNLVKEAPRAYGSKTDPHYYFIHAYNCVYECEYCYLQGYFSSPDIVLFINHEDIGKEIQNIAGLTPPPLTAWFHAGEFSDSLALSHLTKEWPYYFDLFRDLGNAKLELRTKSANVRSLLEIPPAANIITSFSLSPESQCQKFDRKAAPLKARLKAMGLLHQKGHPLGLHLDPVIFYPDFLQDYAKLLRQINEVVPLAQVEYISLGVVRFTKDVFHALEKHYPDSELLTGEYIKSFDKKIRYSRPLRLWILNSLRKLCEKEGLDVEKIYLCMEEE